MKKLSLAGLTLPLFLKGMFLGEPIPIKTAAKAKAVARETPAALSIKSTGLSLAQREFQERSRRLDEIGHNFSQRLQHARNNLSPGPEREDAVYKACVEFDEELEKWLNEG